MLAVLVVLPVLATSAAASDTDGTAAELSTDKILEMEIEDLLDIDVTTIVKKHGKLFDVPAAISVLTADEIRRAGHLSIAESLRMVPGFHVAHIDANKWSVSSRGFAGRFTDKLLVLIDGRSVYTPLFAGVFWDVQDVFLPDLDRIEVIRGPGATLWGANAVNGVVNVVTKSARDTQGLLLHGGGGHQETGFGGARYGGRLGEEAHFRVYAKGYYRDEFEAVPGTVANDEWWQARAGVRVDWDVSDDDLMTVEGALYRGEAGEQLTLPMLTPPFATTVTGEEEVGGGHLLGRWKRHLADDAELELQVYFDRTERDTPIVCEERNTLDIDFQHRFQPFAGHDLLWGAGYRITSDRIEPTFQVAFDPAARTDHLFQFFFQDEIQLGDRFALTLGSKFEHDDYAGFEVQPGARLLWRPNETSRVWGSVTQAVRTPSRADADAIITAAVVDLGGGTPGAATFFGNDAFESEELRSFELGYRVRPTPELLVDVAAFYNVYDGLRTADTGAPTPVAGPPPHMLIPSVFNNLMDAEVYGVEATANWKASERLRFQAGYSFLRLQLHADATSTDADAENAEGESPRHEAFLRGSLDLGKNWEVDVNVQYVDRLSGLGIPSYVRLDLHVGWRPDEQTLLELVVQNILDNQHPEFVSELPFTQNTEVPTTVFLRFTRTW